MGAQVGEAVVFKNTPIQRSKFSGFPVVRRQ